MPKDNYTLAKVCYFITAMFAGFAAFANLRSGRTVLAVVWVILCAVFLFAAYKMKVNGQKAKEIGMVDNSKGARKEAKQRKAALRAAELETAKDQIASPAAGDGNIASAVSASLYSSKGGKKKQSADTADNGQGAGDRAQFADEAADPAEKE
ncbi:MAG: hypothetical protein Q4B51_04145 [Coriobacteriaceae bacterium]|nr:hypothetical protein [Coriobacteriaceae bacterium]MDY4986414.1 hypothetical protein [Eggerthellaceae bacterium]